MSDLSIRVENLGKRYRIGQTVGYKTLRSSLTGAFTAPFRRYKTPLGVQAHSGGHSNTIWALKNVSFEVKRGEGVGIIGHNGSGKSTLLKILSRITAPTEGFAEIHGRVGSLLEVGTGFHQELTGRENIYLNGAVLGMKKAEIERKFDEIVAFAEVENFLDTPVKHYSSGMYVRLAFAVAAHLEPEIMIVDEVLAVGDAAFQKKCLGKMDEVAKGGRTVLFVSHNMTAVESFCQRVIVLKSGLTSFQGNTLEGIKFYFDELKDIPLALNDRKDRQGNGAARVVRVRIINQQGIETNHIGMGESFVVEIQTIGKLKKAVIGIIFGNMFRKQVIRAYTWEQVSDEIELKGSDTIKCFLENFPVMHGIYDIHTWIGKSGELSDYVEKAASLQVTPKDVYKTGRMPDPVGGMAFCAAKWEINGARYK